MRYEFFCNSCNKIFRKNELNYQCPDCHSTMNQIYYPPAVIYKGSGFYTTDYKKDRDPVLENAAEERRKYFNDIKRGITPEY